jgi:MYXO-CTERM domain-containing protein
VKNRLHTKLLTLAAASLIAAPAAHAATNIPILNGDFSLGAFGDYASNDYKVGDGALVDTALVGWTITNAPTGGHIFVAAGALNGGSGNGIGGCYFGGVKDETEKITYTGGGLGNFLANTTYTFSLDVGGTWEAISSSTTIRLTADGLDIASAFVTGTSYAANNFITLTTGLDTTANPSYVGKAIGLSISAQQVSAIGFYNRVVGWDNATLTSVPEPASSVMGLGGIGLLALLRRRRKG